MTQPIALPSRFGRWWVKLGRALGIRVVAPATVELGPGCMLHVDALLPDFGARQGMLLATEADKAWNLRREIDAAGYGFSLLSEPRTLEPTERDVDGAIDMLEDWGWGGDPANEPEWLKRPPLSAPSNLGNEWIALGEVLGFQVIAPAQVRFGTLVAEVDVLLPDFGALYGVLLGTDALRLEELADRPTNKRYAFASLPEPDTSELTEEKVASAIRLLQDWGWNGDASAMPSWMRAEQ